MEKKNHSFKNTIVGALAGCGAVTVSNPFDCAKTRLQLQGELVKTGTYQKVFNGVFDTVIKTARHEGIFAIQKGLVPAYWVQAIMNGIRFEVYETAKKLRSPESRNNTFINFGCGTAGGFIGTVVSSPFQLIKTRQQSKSYANITRHVYDYTGTWDALVKIYKAEGVKGLYHGAFVSGIRTAIGGAIQLSFYDKYKYMAKKYLHMQDGFGLFLVASISATLTNCIVESPMDVVSTRIFQQRYGQKGGELYSGPLDCVVKTVKIEGISGLYKGFSAICARLVPHSIIFLLLSEVLKEKIFIESITM